MADPSEFNIDGLDALLEQVGKGAAAGRSKDWVDDYIWVNVVRKMVQFVNCEPDFAVLMKYRAELAALLRMGQDVRRDMFQAKEAAERLKRAYTARYTQEGLPK